LHQVYEFSEVVGEVFFREKFLSDSLVDVIPENWNVLWSTVSDMLYKLAKLLEVKLPYIILILSH